MKSLSLILLSIQLVSFFAVSLGSISVLRDAALIRSLSSVGLAPLGQPLHADSIADGAEELVGFGSSVLLAKHNHERLVVGAPLFGDGGAVFVYNYDGSEWQPMDMNPILGAIGDRIGNRMSISADGTRLAVRFRTFVRIFDLDDSNATPQDIPGGGATVTLSYDGTLVAVSAEGYMSFTGLVMLYSRQENGSYAPVFQEGVPLVFPGTQALGRYGWATSFNEQGNRLAISAPYHGSGGKLNVGRVRVFQKVGANWTPMGLPNELVGTQEGEGFGFSIDLSADGQFLVVGSPGSHAGGNQKGKVSVYTWENNAWAPVGVSSTEFVGSDDTDRFGRSVAISGDGSRVAASSYAFGDYQGHAVLLERIGNDTSNYHYHWLDEVVGEADDYVGFGLQGISMTSDGVYLAIGAYRGIDDDGRASGEVNVYEYLDEPSYLLPTGVPSLSPTTSPSPSLAPSTSAAPTAPSPYLYQVVQDVTDEDAPNTGNAQYGFALALSAAAGDLLAVGAPKFNNTNGGVFLYKLINDSEWSLTWSVTGNENEKLGNRLSMSADGTRLALRRHNPKSVEIYNVSATGNAVLAGTIPQNVRGDTVTLSPDGSYIAVSQEFIFQGRGKIVVYHDEDGDASSDSWVIAFSNSLDQDETNALARYGWSTAFSESGDVFAVSAPNYDDAGTKNGLVHIFETATWTRQVTLTGAQDLEQFGFSMALSSDGTTLVVGSRGNNGDGILRGQVTAFRLIGNSWTKTGEMSGLEDGDRIGRSLAINHDGTRLAVTSLFHDALSGQVALFHLVDDEWVFAAEREGYLPGDRLGFGAVNGLAMNGDGSRIVTSSMATNGTDVSAIRTLHLINPDDFDYNNQEDLPEFDINGCVCNSLNVCISSSVTPGDSIRLCLSSSSSSDSVFTFIGLYELQLVEDDPHKFTYRAIHEGQNEVGTTVGVSGNNAYVVTPLVDFFSGEHNVTASGVAVLEWNEGRRKVRRRKLVNLTGDYLAGEFSVNVKVEKAITKPPSSTSSGAAMTFAVSLLSSVLVGLLVGA